MGRVDSIYVTFDRLTKSAHFIPIAKSISDEKFANIYIREVVVQHKVPISFVSDRDVCFNYRFWRNFHKELGTQLHFSTTYYTKPMDRVSKQFRCSKICFRHAS